MNRREVIAGLTLPLLSRATWAQPTAKIYRASLVINAGPVESTTEKGGSPFYGALFEELRRLGYEEGRNLIVDRLSGDGRTEGFADLARQATRTAPDVIVTFSARMAVHLNAATKTIPIVALTSDPVAYGLAKSLGRPGGNVTGLSRQLDLTGKLLGLLIEAIPSVTRVGFIAPREVWDQPDGKGLMETAKKLGVTIVGPPLDSPIAEHEFERVVVAMLEQRLDAFLLADAAENTNNAEFLVALLARARRPAIYPHKRYVRAGGLMAYATDLSDLARNTARYVDRILRGGDPAVMPFYENTKYELVLNLNTAKQLGVVFPPTFLARADEVIE
jgi:putative ABC transport system substrate-binding protein